MTTTELILVAILLLNCITLGVLIARGGRKDDSSELIDDITNALSDNAVEQTKQTQDIVSTGMLRMSESVSRSLRESGESTRDAINRISQDQTATLLSMQRAQAESISQLDESLSQKLSQNLDKIRDANERKLAEIQASVNEKLDKSLNERLDSSFAKVTQQLSDLYKSLGELSSMSEGITSLNKTLSNVKTRGTWGEAQLRDIIRETMVPSQYEENVVTKEGSNDPVEFAIKIPSKEDSNVFILLPIDSKFPMDVYMGIVAASENGDADDVKRATKHLEIRIKEEARKIRDKYIAVPKTTNFAIMYLATESLYAEALRIDGLAEYVQRNYSIIIAGPTTITALMNSLRIGFENLTLSKKTEDVRKLLAAIKEQYKKLDELVENAQKRIGLAEKSVGEIGSRTKIINKRLAKISEGMSGEESDSVLGIEEHVAELGEWDE